MSAEGTPFSGSRRGLQVDVAPDRAGAVAEALRDLLGRTDHPAIVPLVDVGVADGRPFLVVASTSGEPLDVALRTYGPANMADALPRLRRIAHALDVAAEHGLCHGALTPHDIIISAHGTSVEGVGIAAALLRQGYRVPLTPPYGAPEVAAGVAGSALADQYALAAIAFEWLFGRAVRGPAEDGLEIPSLRDVDVQALRRAFTTALASDPADRFESCTAFVASLEQRAKVQEFRSADVPKFWGAAGVGELPMYPTEAAPEKRPGITVAASAASPTSRSGAVAVVAIAGIALGAVAFWLTMRSRSNEARSASVAAGQPFTDAQVTPSSPPPPPVMADAGVAPSPAPSTEQMRPLADTRRHADVAPVSRVDAGLLVHSTPAGAAVSIDGINRGVTPVAVRGLALGTRTVIVTRSGYRPSERQITLTSDRPSRTLEVGLVPAVAPARPAQGRPEASSRTKEGGLVVDSRPAGATVSIDDRPVGVTPLTVALAPGTYSVRIERLGYRPVTTTVDVSPGERARVAARLEGGQQEQ